jgi:hypothetical protein
VAVVARKRQVIVIECPACHTEIEFSQPPKRGSLAEKILLKLRAAPESMTFQEIKNAFPNSGQSHISNTLASLKADGLVINVPRNYWAAAVGKQNATNQNLHSLKTDPRGKAEGS